ITVAEDAKQTGLVQAHLRQITRQAFEIGQRSVSPAGTGPVARQTQHQLLVGRQGVALPGHTNIPHDQPGRLARRAPAPARQASRQQQQRGGSFPPLSPKALILATNPGPASTISSAGNRNSIITTDIFADILETRSCRVVMRRSSSNSFNDKREAMAPPP